MRLKLIAVLVLFSLYSFSQEEKIKLHNISFSPVSIYFADRDGGIGGNLGLDFNYEKHIFKLYVGGGSEYAINFGGGSIKDSFEEYNLMYGRELAIKKWLSVDFFAGVGYFVFNYNKGSSDNYYKKEVVGIPLQSKIRFNTGNRFSLGIQLHMNLNSATTIYSPGIFLQWKLGKNQR